MEELHKPFDKKKTVIQIIQEDHDKLEHIEAQMKEMSDNILKIQETIKMWKSMAWVLGGLTSMVSWIVSQTIGLFK